MAVTKLTNKRFAEGVIVSATTVGTSTAMVTNIAGEDATVLSISGYNQHTSAVDLSLCRVPDNAASVGTPDVNDTLYFVTLEAKDSFFLGPEDIRIELLDTNDTITAFASVANKVHIWADGCVEPTTTEI